MSGAPSTPEAAAPAPLTMAPTDDVEYSPCWNGVYAYAYAMWPKTSVRPLDSGYGCTLSSINVAIPAVAMPSPSIHGEDDRDGA